MICPKCHRRKAKKLFNRHRKVCVPTKDDIQHYLNSKSRNSELDKKKGE